MNKEQFLKVEFLPALKSIPADTVPLWGKMNLHQMIEHLSYDGFQVASGKLNLPLVTPPDVVEKMQAFLMSEKPFRPNTPNSLMPSEPRDLRYPAIADSIAELEADMVHFFNVFRGNPSLTLVNPFFGELNYEQWLRLLYKHVTHHLRQFNLDPEQ